MLLNRSSWLSFVFSSLLVLSTAAYEVSVSDKDYDRQICSGMWANQKTFINVTFDSGSQGQLAMVIYEWGDMAYLGKVTSTANDLPKTYVCTSDAVKGGFCDNSQLGRFILDLPSGKSTNDTSFWSARVSFPRQGESSSLPASSDASSSGFWNDPAGNPTPPADNYTTPWRRDVTMLDRQAALNPSPSGILLYQQPIQYNVRKTGYYCVAIVPVTVMQNPARQATNDVPYHPTYTGTIFFRNTFDGRLPATDYPKVNFYSIMFLVYTAVAVGWAWLCYKNLQDLLPIQYYLSSLLGFLIIEMVANWAYYRYLNAHGRGTPSTVFLIVVAILDAGRNALSFFLLLIVSLGLSVVRESLGKTMIKCQALAVAHFIFGVLYAVGIVELELESTSALVLLLFVVPLAFTLSGFLLWILYALNATIAQLASRKQHYKLSMFKWLHRILLLTVLVIAIFFVVSSLTFSGRLAEDYGARSWRVQWWLLDGWLALLYLIDFVAIAYLWRPSPNNRRLAMFDELAQDPEDAEDYDLEALERRDGHMHLPDNDDDAATLVGRAGSSMAEDAVVFDIGDDDADDDEPNAKKRRGGLDHEGEAHEREGLMKDD
ncbi:lung seven transmembrane receptor-domain-containing protein [Rhodofomes roseus]|uniref:Lung seven transmembrane receptor-domain-containing protein n=1 Tax=Rhodofomes roseus TaxID=34475 RepID=A0ABQ8KF47_9APHY|nr:lung seven transmembrane receptor-domain-containing protein [Rhodofomes roseus]KAH9835933.1 lung seven transmembrane receptor-domain-containing protein [Rhodofomes roseus]